MKLLWMANGTYSTLKGTWTVHQDVLTTVWVNFCWRSINESSADNSNKRTCSERNKGTVEPEINSFVLPVLSSSTCDLLEWHVCSGRLRDASPSFPVRIQGRPRALAVWLQSHCANSGHRDAESSAQKRHTHQMRFRARVTAHPV